MLSTLTFILVFSVLILVHELGHFMVARRLGVKVERFSLGFGPKLFGRKKGDTEYIVCAIPLGGYVKLAGDDPEDLKGKPDEYLSKAPGQRLKILLCGPLLNYISGFFCLWLVFSIGYPTLTSKIGSTIEGLGAQQAGIVKGDRIIAIDGVNVSYWEELQRIIHEKKAGDIVKLSVLRDDAVFDMEVEIKEEKLPSLLGDKKSVGLIGVQPSDETVKIRHNLAQALFLGINRLFDFTVLTYKAIWRMLTGSLSLRETVTGPLGIFYITGKTTQLGFVAVVQLMAILNISLAIFNLLPIPILDGGHIFLLLIEKIRGRRLSTRVDKTLTQLGMSLIILLAVFVFYNDLIKFGVFDKISNLLTGNRQN